MIQRNVSINVSYLEIYNEQVHDLLDEAKRNLDVREHKGEVIVDQLTVRQVNSAEQVFEILQQGEMIR